VPRLANSLLAWRSLTIAAASAACEFHHGAPLQQDAPGIDVSTASCRVGAMGSATMMAGTVGLSTGGGTIMHTFCPPDTVFVGVALAMSDQPVNGGDTISAQGLEVACAHVVDDGSGGHTDAPVTVNSDGFGGAGFTPATLTAIAPCPAGAVLTGMNVHGSHYMNLFLAATITCTQLDGTGKPTGTVTVDIKNSGTDTMYPSGASCPAGQQVVKMDADVGAGLDSIALFCAPTTCT
jgi:hypothetical protein